MDTVVDNTRLELEEKFDNQYLEKIIYENESVQ